MSKYKVTANCRQWTYQMCDDVAEIITNEQIRLLNDGKYRGRKQIVDRIIREWASIKLASK